MIDCVRKDRVSCDVVMVEGTPFSRDYGDYYYSSANGVEESRYTYLEANMLPERWREKPQFAIAEAGFGTGLNFLLTYDLWKTFWSRTSGDQYSHPQPSLVYFAFEKHPLTRMQIDSFNRIRQPEWSSLETLLEFYPAEWDQGVYPIRLDETVMLIFMIGEIADTAQSFHEVMRQQGVSYIDAFYLDGFAPSCNPQMWSEEVFGAFRLCSGASTTLSSFSVAGAVKRALRSAGFNVSKRKGFGQKREMLIGSVSSDSEN